MHSIAKHSIHSIPTHIHTNSAIRHPALLYPYYITHTHTHTNHPPSCPVLSILHNTHNTHTHTNTAADPSARNTFDYSSSSPSSSSSSSSSWWPFTQKTCTTWAACRHVARQSDVEMSEQFLEQVVQYVRAHYVSNRKIHNINIGE